MVLKGYYLAAFHFSIFLVTTQSRLSRLGLEYGFLRLITVLWLLFIKDISQFLTASTPPANSNLANLEGAKFHIFALFSCFLNIRLSVEDPRHQML